MRSHMFSKVLLMAFLPLIGGLFACGDGPTAPEPENPIIGTWRMTDTNFWDVYIARVETAYLSRGYTQAQATQQAVNLLRRIYDRQPSTTGNSIDFLIRFNNDGTFQDNQGDAGTWRTQGNELITTENGQTDRVKYFIHNNELSLIFPLTFFTDLFQDTVDTATNDLFNSFLTESEVFTVFLVKTPT